MCPKNTHFDDFDTKTAPKKIVFAPDRLLGQYMIKKTGRDMVLWNGTCQVHEIFSERELVRLKVKHENAKVLSEINCALIIDKDKININEIILFICILLIIHKIPGYGKIK